MQRKVLALMIPALLMAGSAHAAEIYNKDGNKLDLYGKVDGLHYFSDNKGADGDQTYMRLGFKGETQINNTMTGYAQWEYNIQANNTEGSDNQSWTRLAFAGVKVGDYGSFDYGRNYGVLYDVEGWTDMLPEFGGDSYTKADNFMTGRCPGPYLSTAGRKRTDAGRSRTGTARSLRSSGFCSPRRRYYHHTVSYCGFQNTLPPDRCYWRHTSGPPSRHPPCLHLLWYS